MWVRNSGEAQLGGSDLETFMKRQCVGRPDWGWDAFPKWCAHAAAELALTVGRRPGLLSMETPS